MNHAASIRNSIQLPPPEITIRWGSSDIYIPNFRHAVDQFMPSFRIGTSTDRFQRTFEFAANEDSFVPLVMA